ncbi:MAG: alpha/beta fold hydrolase [Marinicellaceae bacterium]
MVEIEFKCRFGKIAGLCWGQGNKKKILALHGWLDNAASFYQIAPLLAEIGYEVVAIDFAGHGHSDHRAKGHFCHFIDFVLDVQDVLKELDWKKPILLGHSMGAAMAQMYAASFPEKIKKLIMIENIGPVPYYEKGTAASNLREALTQWKNHTTEHKHFYDNVKTALKARIKVTPISEKNLYPLVERGLKKTKKGFHWRTDKRLRLRSPFRFSDKIVQDMLSSEKPPTFLILADPYTYALSYKSVEKRIKKLNPNNFSSIKGHHHLHMDNAKEVFTEIQHFLLS